MQATSVKLEYRYERTSQALKRLIMLLFITVFLQACSTTAMVSATDAVSMGAPHENPQQWTWIPVEESVCRDGSPTGIGVRLQDDATGVLVYFQGGGACYDEVSCAQNEEGLIAGAHYNQNDFQSWSKSLGKKGIFNIHHNKNPVGNWNHVYFPYCSADLHAGQKRNAKIEHVSGLQQFNGRENTRLFLEKLQSVLPINAKQYPNSSTSSIRNILVAGSSAGALGVLLNYESVANTFSTLTVDALIDSAPIISGYGFRTDCLQENILSTFEPHTPEKCPHCADASQGGLSNLYSYLGKTYPNARFGLTSANTDMIGIVVMNKESPNCGGSYVHFLNYYKGIEHFKNETLMPSGNWSTFYWSGMEHTAIQSNYMFFYNTVSRLSMADWLDLYLSKKTLHLEP